MDRDGDQIVVYATICKEFTFDAAHRIPWHQGKCAEFHGHTYKLQIFARGDTKPVEDRSDGGMVVDFDVIKTVYKEKLESYLDHQYLNRSVKEIGVCPCRTRESVNCSIDGTTAELLANWILHVMQSWVSEVFKVRLYETPTSYAEVEEC